VAANQPANLRLSKIDDFGRYCFSGDFKQSNRGFGQEGWFRVGGASGVNVESFVFPFYAGTVGVAVNEDVKVVLFGDFAHFAGAVMCAWIVHDADFPLCDFKGVDSWECT